jgi:fructose-1,6-bisphosphatase/inositol monophosphatase family enzyme
VIDEVGELMRAVARTAILPLYQRLAAGDVEEKAPGDVVTVADRWAEELLDAGLTGLLPGSTVVGEEGVAADAALLDRLADAGPVWLVDPLDGTANFAAGHEPFAVMVALLVDGVTRTGWILDLGTDDLVVADAGAGAYLLAGAAGSAGRPDARRITADQDAPPLSALRGNVRSKYLPSAVRAAIDRRAGLLGEALPGTGCAGREYPDVIAGVQDFALFWRTLPWDHAAGVLFTHEAGGVARGLDGRPYLPTDPRPGLLVARNERVWQQVYDGLLAPEAGLSGAA